ncbi:ubiquitin-like protein [Colletotrichum chrysophilum]|uniref:Ubiquitin-like protein n=1 Tax=Colletotrichum chrysophilum TaxID=1836956 RepID=A0AAD9EP76_9PEZI|nr:ubiquitin-like protein [Colletotrichum chrysophilum]
MEMTLEAIIAIVSLVVGLPPTIFILWRCFIHQSRASRCSSQRSPTSFDRLPYQESFSQQSQHPTLRSWTFVGFEVDITNQAWHNLRHFNPMAGSTPRHSFRSVGHRRDSVPVWNQMRGAG